MTSNNRVDLREATMNVNAVWLDFKYNEELLAFIDKLGRFRRYDNSFVRPQIIRQNASGRVREINAPTPQETT